MVQLLATIIFIYGAYRFGYWEGGFDADIEHIMNKEPLIVEMDDQFMIEQTISVTYKAGNLTTTVNPN